MTIIDVREPFEFAQNHVEGAINLPISQLMDGNFSQIENIKRDEKIIVYCRSGGRAHQAIKILKQLGFQNTQNGINQSEVEAQRCDG